MSRVKRMECCPKEALEKRERILAAYDWVSDDETFTKHPYQPLRKKVCPARDEPLLPISRTLHFKPTLRWEAQKHSSLNSIKENEPAKAEIKKAMDLRKAATRQSSMTPNPSVRPQKQHAAPSISTKTIQPKLTTYLECQHEGANNRKILKIHKSSSVKEKTESWPRKCLGNINNSNKKPLPVSSTRWRPNTIAESFRIEEKRQYQQLLQKCTLDQSHSSLSPSHSIYQISSSSSNSSSPLTCDVRWSIRSTSHSVQSEAESENTSPTSSSTNRLLKSSELETKHSRKEMEPSEDHKKHSSHHKTYRAKALLSDITMRKEFRNDRMGTHESVIRSGSVCVDSEEEYSLDQLAGQCYSERKKCSPIPVIDLCHSDSDSIESIKDSDSDSIEIVDEFPHGRRKTSLLEGLYDRKWMMTVHDEHSSTNQTADTKNRMDDELELERRKSSSQSLHDKVQNRLKHLDIICASKDRCRPPTVSIKKPPFAPLTPDMQAEIEAALIPYPASEILIHKFHIKIRRRDIATLDGFNWLNDEVINFYLNLIMERSVNKKGLPKVYVFSTFFYPKLHKSGHKSVSRWTKTVDIFSYDILLVPIHLGVHWCMATVDFKKRCITYYDSMLGNNSPCLEHLLEYLEAEHLDKKKTSFRTTSWKLESMKNIPEQMNGSDCGVFSCKFAEYKSRQAPLHFTQEDMPYFRRRMVYEIIKAELLE